MALHGGGWGSGVPPGLQNHVRRPCGVGWVRFPHAPARLSANFRLLVNKSKLS